MEGKLSVFVRKMHVYEHSHINSGEENGCVPLIDFRPE